MSEAAAEAPATLRWAAALVWAQAVPEIIVVAWRDDLTPGLRGMLIIVLALQLVFAQRALRLRAGAVLGLFAFELMTIVAAAGAGGSAALRTLLAAGAVAVIALLALSLRAFPSPTLPRGGS